MRWLVSESAREEEGRGLAYRSCLCSNLGNSRIMDQFNVLKREPTGGTVLQGTKAPASAIFAGQGNGIAFVEGEIVDIISVKIVQCNRFLRGAGLAGCLALGACLVT